MIGDAANTSRSMIATILWRLEGEPDAADPGSFADVADGKWYSKAVAWAAGNGIVDAEIWANIVLDELSGRMEYLHQFVRENSNGLYGTKH
jgi:hypothetical protein